jgi:phosphatidylserine/phosphatidylglycerophosphate/cardiolipin synthase-like enzyme
VNAEDKAYMHARAIIIDDKALIGTTSLSTLSLDLKRDLNFVIEGKTVETLVQQFDSDWDQVLSLEKGRQVAKEKEIDWKKLFFQK